MKVLSNYQCKGQMSLFDLDIWSGKMSSARSVQEAPRAKISELYLKKPQKSQTKTPLFLDLRGGGGQQAGASWQMGGLLLGEYTTHSFGESPKDAAESRLSQILTDRPPQRYYLSAKACQGLLNRIAKGGKKIPKPLEDALIQQATPSKLGGGREYDSHGRKAGKGALVQTELSGTLGVSQDQTLITIGHDVRSARFTDDEITDPLTATDYKDPIKVCRDSTVRRLTPTECERLQAFPDDWTNIGEWTDSKGKTHKDADSPRYKALGNSIALPFWAWMAKRMVSHMKTDAPTMASLFDGIGGFPLVFSQSGCKPIWASEVEEFPIAVTKIRFPEESE